MQNSENLLSNELQLDSSIQSHLKETASWAKFLGIIGFIVTGLIAIAAFFAGTIISAMMSSGTYGGYTGTGATFGGLVTVFYLFIAAIGFFISLFTYKFGNRTKKALQLNDQESLNAGLMNLKFVFRFYGIIMIINIGFMVLAMVGGMLGALLQR